MVAKQCTSRMHILISVVVILGFLFILLFGVLQVAQDLFNRTYLWPARSDGEAGQVDEAWSANPPPPASANVMHAIDVRAAPGEQR